MTNSKLLIIDDEKLIRWSLREDLSRAGYEVFTAETGREGLKIAEQELPDLILLDIQLPDINGIDLLKKIKQTDENVLVIMITAHGALDSAIKAMKLGAYDYLNKPFDLEEVKISIEKALETTELKKEVSTIKLEQRKRYSLDQIIGKSAKMQKVLGMASKVAKSDATTVLIQGESGTGKDLIARAIHYQGARGDKPYMEINCTSLPETLIESELFGHEKGAFTDAKFSKKGLFELADGGTVFLDEIGDMTNSTQSKLLRIIETKTFKKLGGNRDITVDIRVIAATNKNLDEATREGRFREDLYYRLKVIPILLPPLRDRKEDIPLLIKHFIQTFNHEFKKNLKGISKEAEKILLNYDWPGNVRELKNILERAMILESEETILAEHIPLEISSPVPFKKSGEFLLKLPKDGISLEDVEKELLQQALSVANGNQTKAAQLLKISRDTLRYRIKKFDLPSGK